MDASMAASVIAEEAHEGPKKPPKGLVVGTLLLVASCIVLVLGMASGHVQTDRVFHPEALYPAALGLDLAEEPMAWRSWSTPPAPYLFPDLLIYGSASAIVSEFGGGVRASLFFFAAVQLVGLALGLAAVAGWLAGPRGDPVLLVAAIVLAFGAGSWGFHGRGLLLQAAAPAFHVGAVLVGIWCLHLLLDLAQRGTRRRLLLVLASLVFLTTWSDRLFVAFFVLPAVLALLWTRAERGRDGRALLALAGTVAGAAAAGWLALPLFEWLGPDVPSLHRVDASAVAARAGEILFAPGQWLFVVDRFFEGLGWGYRIGFLAWLGALAWTAFRGRALAARLAARWLLLAAVVTTAATFWITVGDFAVRAGNESLLFVNRYLVGVYLLPVAGLGWACASWRRLWTPSAKVARWVPRVGLALAALVVGGALLRHGAALWSDGVVDPAPDVRCVRQALAPHDARLGLAHFYAARRLSVWTQGRLHADQLSDDLEPMTWIDSRRREGRYRFVVLDRLEASAVEARFGAPDHRADCAGSRVWIWDRTFSDPPDRPATSSPPGR